MKPLGLRTFVSQQLLTVIIRCRQEHVDCSDRLG